MMNDQKKSEEIASQRVQSIAPLLQPALDPATYQTLKDQIAAETGLSERTIRRYVNHYRQNGFSGLKPKGKAKATTNRASIPVEVLEQAIQLRREMPSRSIAQIIRILEWEGRCAKGQIKRSTLQDQLAARGYSSAQMRMYGERGLAARRFQRQHRNELWQSDIKFGPHLKIGPKGESVPVYLVVFIDDATRFVVQASFFTSLEQRIVTDAFRQAIRLHGAPDRVYFDNGKQYKSKAMIRTCSKLAIRLLFAKPYSPESKGYGKLAVM
jgi:putative transposase